MARRKTTRRRRLNAAMGYRGSRRTRTKNRSRYEPLIPAKLKRMPNGRYKIYVSPGAMAKMQLNPEFFGQRPADQPPRAFVSSPRRDGRFSVQLVYPMSGARRTKIMTRDQVVRLKEEGYQVYGYRVNRRRR